MLRLFLVCCAVSLLSVTGLAQRYGHLNFANLLSQMPETKVAETQLATFNQQLVAKGEKMVEELKARVADIERRGPDLSPVKIAAFKAELNDERNRIAVYERQVGMDTEKKRQELLGPIVKKLRAAVRAVAQENNFQLVFDTSIFNNVLYAQESEDLLPLVKAKLGL